MRIMEPINKLIMEQTIDLKLKKQELEEIKSEIKRDLEGI